LAKPNFPNGRTPTEQHNREIHENRRAWDAKPVLREVYNDLYRRLAQQLAPSSLGQTVELGSGMGNIKKFVPECITTDLFPNPWLDRVENAYALSFQDHSLANLILFDVWHHLEYPANALAEATRVLAPGGRLIIMDPAMSLTGHFVYGLFHHEPLGCDTVFASAPVTLDEHAKLPYFAAQSSAHRLLEKQEIPQLLDGWRVVDIEWITSFAYLASGGFRGRQLYPAGALPLVRSLDRLLGRWPKLFAARLLVVLTRWRHD
jgi:SAM-dependent methyltransferase